MVIIITIIGLLIPLVSFFNLKISIALCLAFEILVPSFFDFRAIGMPVPFRLIYPIIFLAFIYKYLIKHKRKINLFLFKRFLYLAAILLFFIAFQSRTPVDYQLFSWLKMFLVIAFFSIVVWNHLLYEPTSVLLFRNTIIFAAIISLVYGLFLTMTIGINPYLLSFGDYFANSFSSEYALAESEGRLFGRIQSTFLHPMSWAFFLVLLLSLVFAFYLNENKKKYLFLMGLIVANIFVCGVRTGILSASLALCYYMLKNRKNLYAIFALVVVIAIVGMVNQDFNDYLTSIIDVNGKKNNIQGSSFQMRLDQLSGSFKEIQGRELVGNGFGWTSYYQSKFGDHPQILAFESILFVIICNSGFLGLIAWVIFFFSLFFFNRKILKGRDIIICDMLLISYISYSLITGEYGYIQIFSIYYSFLISYLCFQNYYGNKQQLKDEVDSKLSPPVPPST